jgi:hypothetical protein
MKAVAQFDLLSAGFPSAVSAQYHRKESREKLSHSGGKEIFRLVTRPKVYYCVHMIPPKHHDHIPPLDVLIRAVNHFVSLQHVS